MSEEERTTIEAAEAHARLQVSQYIREQQRQEHELDYIATRAIIFCRREIQLPYSYHVLKTCVNKNAMWFARNWDLRWILSLLDTIVDHDTHAATRARAGIITAYAHVTRQAATVIRCAYEEKPNWLAEILEDDGLAQGTLPVLVPRRNDLLLAQLTRARRTVAEDPVLAPLFTAILKYTMEVDNTHWEKVLAAAPANLAEVKALINQCDIAEPVPLSRDDFPAFLNARGLNGHWLELGVAGAIFHRTLLDNANPKPSMLWGVDRWSDHHGIEQYKQAAFKTSQTPGASTILRLDALEACTLFEDEFFDFIYVDLYAHEGQMDGAALLAWWPKLKPGGVFAGHDYHEKFPLTIQQVDGFLVSQGLPKKKQLTATDEYPSWWLVKP